MTVAFRYDPSRGRYRGVPSRDITVAEYAAMDPGQRRTIRLADAYTEVEAPRRLEDMRRADLDSLAAERGIDPGEHSNRESLIAALNETEG